MELYSTPDNIMKHINDGFHIMSVLYKKDKSINDYAGLENYFDKVHEVMKRYLGNVDGETRIVFARNLFCHGYG